MIFGNWKPVGIALGSLLFGFLKCLAVTYNKSLIQPLEAHEWMKTLLANNEGFKAFYEAIFKNMYFYNLIPFVTVLIVLADADSPYAVQDGSLVLGNLMNAAKALGIGSCWINRAREVFDAEEGRALLKKWGIEGKWIGIGNCILGYPDEDPAMKPRKENHVWYVL